MVNEEKHRGLHVLLILWGLCLLVMSVSDIILPEVNADTESISTEVTITGAVPSVGSITCCFREAGSSDEWADCGGSYTMAEATDYEARCNFTVTDTNGYQDMGDGWVNTTWYRSGGGIAWNSANDNDNHYTNSSCRNISGTASGTDIDYECHIRNIKYYADGGTWNIHINLSDGENANTGSDTIAIANVTSIWQSGNINFGSMNLGTNGSGRLGATGSGACDINATTNNTGNTVLDIYVEGDSSLSCTVGSIPVGNVKYDVTYDEDMDTACGALSDSSEWGCAGEELNLDDCSDACGSYPMDYTHWGITIPDEAVGGSCSMTITVSAQQAG